MKQHVKVDEWQTGGFQIERHVKCRCGWRLSHYNRGYLNEQFKIHQADSSVQENEVTRQSIADEPFGESHSPKGK